MDDDRLLQYKMMFLDPEEDEAALKKLKEEDETEKTTRRKVEIPDYVKKYIGQETECAVCLVEQIRTLFFAPLDTRTESSDEVEEDSVWIINTERGREIARVLHLIKYKFAENDVPVFGRLVKEAAEKDIHQEERNREREKKAFDICKKKIEKLNLVMKLVKVHYLFDGGRIMFYFTAPSKVDFRELVRQLASVFRTRIELRQIGVRDETKLIGGIGPCGMHICCHRFLSCFKSVSIKMAKDQNLVLNPGKISGICGRLLCCLNYENSVYVCERKKLPHMESTVLYEKQEARVIGQDILKQTVRLLLKDESVKDVHVSEVTRTNRK